jgi:hypothetical protein
MTLGVAEGDSMFLRLIKSLIRFAGRKTTEAERQLGSHETQMRLRLATGHQAGSLSIDGQSLVRNGPFFRW